MQLRRRELADVPVSGVRTVRDEAAASADPGQQCRESRRANCRYAVCSHESLSLAAFLDEYWKYQPRVIFLILAHHRDKLRSRTIHLAAGVHGGTQNRTNDQFFFFFWLLTHRSGHSPAARFRTENTPTQGQQLPAKGYFL
jgi:hypothetical protein